jgi:hypothetical protein
MAVAPDYEIDKRRNNMALRTWNDLTEAEKAVGELHRISTQRNVLVKSKAAIAVGTEQIGRNMNAILSTLPTDASFSSKWQGLKKDAQAAILQHTQETVGPLLVKVKGIASKGAETAQAGLDVLVNANK